MNQQLTAARTSYVDPAHQKYMSDLRQELIQQADVQGKHDGLKNRPASTEEHRALFINSVEVTVQGGIDHNQMKYLPKSGVAVARIIEAEASQRVHGLQGTLGDLEHTIRKARMQAKGLQPDMKLIAFRRWVLGGMVFISCAEGASSYLPFRHANYTPLFAFVASVGVAIGVGIAAHFGGGFVKKAANGKARAVRFLLMIAPATIGFWYLARLRADVATYTFNPLADPVTTTECTNCIVALSMAVISILLYAVAVWVSSLVFRSDAERKQEYAYEETCKEVRSLEKEIAAITAELTAVQSEKQSGIASALARWEYGQSTEHNLRTIAHEAVEAYKQSNIRHRTDGCPAFFCQKPHFDFTTFFSMPKSDSHETV